MPSAGLRDPNHRGAAKMDGGSGLRQRDLLSDVATGRWRGIGTMFPAFDGKYIKREIIINVLYPSSHLLQYIQARTWASFVMENLRRLPCVNP